MAARPVGICSWAGRHTAGTADGGGTNLLAAPFVPKTGQRYKIDIAREGDEVTISVDGTSVAKSKAIPFTDLAQDVTVGGRPGPSLLALSAAISDVQIARQRPPMSGAR